MAAVYHHGEAPRDFFCGTKDKEWGTPKWLVYFMEKSSIRKPPNLGGKLVNWCKSKNYADVLSFMVMFTSFRHHDIWLSKNDKRPQNFGKGKL